MAEFGTFAAALQIAETVLKFKKIWDEIRHSSEELNELVEEVVLHADLLGSLRRQAAAPTTGADDECWKRCCQFFERCVTSFEALTDELSSIRQKHAKTASIRLYLHRDQLKSCRERLQTTQAIMLLAQQAYSIAISTSHQARVLEELQRLTQLTRNAPVEKVKHRTKRPTAKKSRDRSSAIDKSATSARSNLLQKTGRQKRLTGSDAVSIVNPQFPMWSVSKSAQVWFYRDSRSFCFNFRTFNTRPNDTNLFKASRSGNWTEVWQMISNGTASLNDVDEWRNTLLHIAASQARIDVCRLLISQGLDASSRTWPDNRTPLETLASTFRHMHEKDLSNQALLETTRLLIASSQANDVDYSSEPKHWLHRCSLPACVLSVLIAAVIPAYKKVDPTVRSRLAISTTSSDPKSINALLGPNLNLRQAIKLTPTSASGGYGYRQLILNASRCLARPDVSDKQRTGWLSVLSSIISCEAQNKTSSPFRSLYMHFIAYYGAARRVKTPMSARQTWNELLTTIGRHWLNILVTCGANLERYSKAEKATLKHPEVIIWRDTRGRSHCWRLKFLLCGPEIDDWKVYAVPSVYTYRQNEGPSIRRTVSEGHAEYEMAGEFWSHVEACDTSRCPEADEQKVDLTNGKSVTVKGPIF